MAGTAGLALGRDGTAGLASGRDGTAGLASGRDGTAGLASGRDGTAGLASGRAGTAGLASGRDGTAGLADAWGWAGADVEVGVLGLAGVLDDAGHKATVRAAPVRATAAPPTTTRRRVRDRDRPAVGWMAVGSVGV